MKYQLLKLKTTSPLTVVLKGLHFSFGLFQIISRIFYKDLHTILLSHNISQRDLTHASNCKQSPQELFSAYLKRFNAVWTEHTDLGTDVGILFILTCLTEHAQALRLTSPKLMQKTSQALAKRVRELEATGAMVIKAPTVQLKTTMHACVAQKAPTARPQGWKLVRRQGECHYCHKPGHWA